MFICFGRVGEGSKRTVRTFIFYLPEYLVNPKTSPTFAPRKRRDARVVEEARLESVYTPKGYHEFESRSLRTLFVKMFSFL